MIRLFAALAIPPEIGVKLRSRQTGIGSARWRPLEALHVTLRFFGEVREDAARDLTGIGTILLVEDEDAVRLFSARALRNKGYQVLEARSGEAALETFKKYDRNTLPVTDSEEKLLGIVTIDDMLDVQEEQTTEEIQKLGGTEALNDPYMDTPVWELVKKRAVWLIVLFLGGMLTTTVIGRFASSLEKAVVLSIFMPLIISAGGNAGSQASTLIIRAMSLGEIDPGETWKVAWRELRTGFFLGLLAKRPVPAA